MKIIISYSYSIIIQYNYYLHAYLNILFWIIITFKTMQPVSICALKEPDYIMDKSLPTVVKKL